MRPLHLNLESKSSPVRLQTRSVATYLETVAKVNSLNRTPKEELRDAVQT